MVFKTNKNDVDAHNDVSKPLLMPNESKIDIGVDEKQPRRKFRRRLIGCRNWKLQLTLFVGVFVYIFYVYMTIDTQHKNQFYPGIFQPNGSNQTDKTNDAEGTTTSTEFPATTIARTTVERKPTQSTESTTAKTTTLTPTKTLIPITDQSKTTTGRLDAMTQIMTKATSEATRTAVITTTTVATSTKSKPKPFKTTEMSATSQNRQATTTSPYANETLPDGYLVYSSDCHIRALDPFAEDVMELYKKEDTVLCRPPEPLTKIRYNWSKLTADLVLDTELKDSGAYADTTCCYQEISRSGEDEDADDEFSLSECEPFDRTFELPPTKEFIMVKCSTENGTSLYMNAHAVMRERPDLRARLDEGKQKNKQTRPLSVLMLAIDSVSRLNLMRTMPLTAKYLHDSRWFELQGYNKIDENTFPNVMAILTGYNDTSAHAVCKPKVVGKLDECPLMWKEFRDRGYVSAYGEDETWMSTFNYLKKGFYKPPTDYYLRPYVLAIYEHLNLTESDGIDYCLGYDYIMDHIFGYAIDYATLFKNDPYFGLFWSNSFSHTYLNGPTSMDDAVNANLVEMEKRGIFNDSMVVFFSDHGMRYGKIRFMYTGWYEERLPYMFISLPPWFKHQHPEIVEALTFNQNRLTNPFDLHMTLKHILELSGRADNLPPAPDCPNCSSLFRKMPARSCEDAAIPDYWCTCESYKEISIHNKTVKTAVEFAIDQINIDLRNQTNQKGEPLCAELKLGHISSARVSETGLEESRQDIYMCTFSAEPSDAQFEASVKHLIEEDTFELNGPVSRINRYEHQADCMTVATMRKYCYCLK